MDCVDAGFGCASFGVDKPLPETAFPTESSNPKYQVIFLCFPSPIIDGIQT